MGMLYRANSIKNSRNIVADIQMPVDQIISVLGKRENIKKNKYSKDNIE
jgi:hypothetical protein